MAHGGLTLHVLWQVFSIVTMYLHNWKLTESSCEWFFFLTDQCKYCHNPHVIGEQFHTSVHTPSFSQCYSIERVIAFHKCSLQRLCPTMQLSIIAWSKCLTMPQSSNRMIKMSHRGDQNCRSSIDQEKNSILIKSLMDFTDGESIYYSLIKSPISAFHTCTCSSLFIQ